MKALNELKNSFELGKEYYGLKNDILSCQLSPYKGCLTKIEVSKEDKLQLKLTLTRSSYDEEVFTNDRVFEEEGALIATFNSMQSQENLKFKNQLDSFKKDEEI